jgi:4-hydroxy-2-oxoheptanedioate aldolase
VNTAADALAAVQFAKFAPLGHRGWAGGRAAYGVAAADFAQHANEQTLVAVMIEEAEALHNLDEMLRVEHVDVFFVAPGDLAQSMGFAGLVDHPSVVGAMDDALRRIRAAGRVSGTLTSPAQLDHHLESGVQYLYVALPALLAPSAATFVGRVASGS